MTEPDTRQKKILFVVNDAPFFLSHRLPLALAARDSKQTALSNALRGLGRADAKGKYNIS